MKWTDPESGEEQSLYPTEELQRDLRQFSATACEHPHVETRWSPVRGGSRALRDQCIDCGALVGNPHPKSRARPETKAADMAALEAYKRVRKRAYDQILRHHAEAQQRDHSNWKGQHAAYLQSPEWRARRDKILKRAGGLCEGCRERPATVAHHLTYEHWRRELLFELVALCEACHEICHESARPQ